MTEKGVHYLAQAKIKERLLATKTEIDKVSIQLQEALKMGDLRENSEYDAAKEAMRKATKERDMLSPVLSMPVIKANDSVSILEEGCIIDLKVYGTTDEPLDTASERFKRYITEQEPVFEGILMFGGTLPIQELLVDAALDVETDIGSYLLGKPSGNYSIKVPGGFANVSVKKLKSSEYGSEDLGCVYRGI